MDIAPVEIRYYQTASEKRPFQEWLDGLDGTLQQIVAVRLARIRRGREMKRQSADIQRAQAFWQDYLRRTPR